MTRAHKLINLAGVVLPPLGIVVGATLLWGDLVGPHDIAIMLAMYVITGLGITIGFHRMLTHRAFKTSAPVRGFWSVAGSLAVQGSPLKWVADHRKHHAFSDEEGDPHSPHLAAEEGFRGMVKGFVHAHIGWLFSDVGQADVQRYAPDLASSRFHRWIDRNYLVPVLATLLIPTLLGWAITGTWTGAVTGLLWGGAVRIFLLHHVTWSINSVCHMFGRRRFETDDESRNVFWLAPLSFGEAWHHNHHTFPTSAFHGLKRWEVDPAGYVIRAMERTGLIWDVVRVSPEKQAAKLMTAARDSAAGATGATRRPATGA
jgi:stearoyl-CoA desaturase (Delta-9 desaturase)